MIGGPAHGREYAVPNPPRHFEVPVAQPQVYVGETPMPLMPNETALYTRADPPWDTSGTTAYYIANDFANAAATNTTVSWSGSSANYWQYYTAQQTNPQQVREFWLAERQQQLYNQWVTPYQTAGSQWVAALTVTPVPALTQEEADQRLAATRAEMHKNAIRRRKAHQKGRRLLLAVLTEFQQHEYARNGYFTVKATDGKFFRVRKGKTIHELGPTGVPIFTHCIHLPYSYIDEDSMVAVKMLLETDAAEFRRIANTSPLSGYGPSFNTDAAAGLARGFVALTAAAQDATARLEELATAMGAVREAMADAEPIFALAA